MFRVLLITKNRTLGEFCRKNLPEGFRLKTIAKLNLRTEVTHGIMVFDSAYLAETSDSIIAAAADRFGAKDGAVSLNILMNDENRAESFSLFPENLAQVHAILSYRIQGNRVQGLGATEWRWFLETQRKHLKQLGDRVLTLGENQLLAERLAQIKPDRAQGIGFPAFMHGRSQAIVHFREQIFKATSALPYLFITGKDEVPLEEFLGYYCELLRPDAAATFRLVDLEKIPKHLHAQALWPAKSKRKGTASARETTVTCVRNLQLLGWQNQASLLQQLKNLRDKSPDSLPKNHRYVFAAPHEINQFVKRGSFRQELLSLLRKATAELPPLYDRPEDITHIASEFIRTREFTPLREQSTEIAAKIMARFDLSSGYRGLFMTLELMNDLEKSKGLPVFELRGASDESEAYIAARSFLREQIEPSPSTLFQGLAGGEKEALSLDYVERNYIAAVCERYAWQVTDAARHLGISRKTLYDKMRRYKLTRPESSRKAGQRAS